ncbi:MAG: SMC family ATPase [Chloroflexi bacterium]|nr:SMC family ATPase [Chloroflexota bacterium]
MIPLSLTIKGFLSYREAVTLDLSQVELACISGANGAGKSSLLDAITWALFGQARKRDESLVNAHSQAAEVQLVFAYEGNLYRIQRTLPRGKTNLLEFQVSSPAPPQVWKPLTEHTLRETQARIEGMLRMDYETFVNASFFLQGKADSFTKQRPGDRKRLLASILGLEVWEAYRKETAKRRGEVESEIAGVEGRLGEIEAELGEEEARKARLAALEADLERLAQARSLQESALEGIRRAAAALAEQRKWVEALARQAEASARQATDMQARLEARHKERDGFSAMASRGPEIEAAYRAWQQARADIEYWDDIAARFRQQEKRRQSPLDELNAARAGLLKEKQTLEAQRDAAERAALDADAAQVEIAATQAALDAHAASLAARPALENELHSARQAQADARAENPVLRTQMEELKERIERLEQAEGAACPLCGQPLSAEERGELIARLSAQGKQMGDRYRANQALLRQAEQDVKALEEQLRSLAALETAAGREREKAAALTARLQGLQAALQTWESTGAPRLAESARLLEEETFHPEARARLAEIDAELKATGYDAAAHDAARRTETGHRNAETELRQLERARAALAPLEREIAEIEKALQAGQAEAERQRAEWQAAAASLAAAEAQTPDLQAAQRELHAAQEQENRLRLEVGQAQQLVKVLASLKARRKEMSALRAGLAGRAAQYKQLERAFGRDGVPALLIEQALPQIEARANSLLERLSAGGMSVRFVTQTAYKDPRRAELKETLDIQISDSAGTRDYEMFSGGEAFRVDFAIRLALSEVLAQRAGARLQTLVIDEGFGSQDADGRQRLVEAINLVQKDFSRVLVITHIDELKDAFPTRIEVEKTRNGSIARVV